MLLKPYLDQGVSKAERPWRGGDPPGVVYFHAPSGGKNASLGLQGILQTDSYAGYNQLRRPDRSEGVLKTAVRWNHCRRRLKEIWDSGASPDVKVGLDLIAELYAIEARIPDQSPATRQFVRWTASALIVNRFGVWLDAP